MGNEMCCGTKKEFASVGDLPGQARPRDKRVFGASSPAKPREGETAPFLNPYSMQSDLRHPENEASVYFMDGRWWASIAPHGQKVQLGSYATAEEAARAWDAAYENYRNKGIVVSSSTPYHTPSPQRKSLDSFHCQHSPIHNQAFDNDANVNASQGSCHAEVYLQVSPA